jgi:hypothetical protein
MNGKVRKNYLLPSSTYSFAAVSLLESVPQESFTGADEGLSRLP